MLSFLRKFGLHIASVFVTSAVATPFVQALLAHQPVSVSLAAVVSVLTSALSAVSVNLLGSKPEASAKE